MANDSNLERPLPHNLEAERSILGAILLDNHMLNTAVEKLRSDDFFLDQHRRIFERMMTLGETQQAIDLVTLTEDLHRRSELDAAGGAAYLAQLVDGVPRISNVEHYARIVKEKAVLRSLAHRAHAIQQQALDADEDADAILDRAESSIFELAEDRVRSGLIGNDSRKFSQKAAGSPASPPVTRNSTMNSPAFSPLSSSSSRRALRWEKQLWR